MTVIFERSASLIGVILRIFFLSCCFSFDDNEILTATFIPTHTPFQNEYGAIITLPNIIVN